MKINKISNPKITILMSVYNNEKYLRESIESILNQTYNNFEFLIINDASTDSSKDIILSYNDFRIRLVDNAENIGLSKSLNKGIELAKGEYIARMDADDISLPERLEKQLNFIEQNPGVGVCGTWYKKFGYSEKIIKTPEKSDKIKLLLFCKNVIGHSTVMIRKEHLTKNGIKYNENLEKAQDYDLWVRLSEYTDFYNIPNVYVLYRIHSDQISTYSKNKQDYYADKVRFCQLRKLGIKPKKTEWAIHKAICNDNYSIIKINILENWFERLILANRESLYYPDKEFSKFLYLKYWCVCKSFGMKGASVFRKSRLNKLYKPLLKIIIKSIIYSKIPVKYIENKLKGR